MKTITFKAHHTKDVIFEGQFHSQKDALEAAIHDNVTLKNIDLSHMNLQNVTLDEATLSGALLRGTNLQGANLSDAIFIDCNLSAANLTSACLVESRLENCHFGHTQFGNTLVQDTILTRCSFTGPSALYLDFKATKSMLGCSYATDVAGQNCTKVDMSKPPIVILGLNTRPIAFFDDYILCGSSFFERSEVSIFGT